MRTGSLCGQVWLWQLLARNGDDFIDVGTVVGSSMKASAFLS